MRAIAKSIDVSFSRIQFTPDLLPADLIGISVFNPKDGKFHFQKGPLHSQIVLADEINRTSPKTQSSLLEVMQEQQITVDNHTYKLNDPFMVIATQNPIEHEGTFPLPESQLDRFFMKLSLGYPNESEELALLSDDFEKNELKPVLKGEDIISARDEVEKIYVSDSIKNYIVKLCRRTRNHPAIELGASPRATLALYNGGKALAYIKSRDFVTPEDIQYIYSDILSHRIFITAETRYQGRDSKSVLKDILNSTPIPVGD